MSNEITLLSGLSVANGNDREELKTGPNIVYANQTTPGSTKPTQLIGTSEEDIVLTDITTPGWVEILNLDSTNYCQLGPKSGGSMIPFLKLLPGKTAGPFYLDDSVTMRAKANTAAVRLKFLACER